MIPQITLPGLVVTLMRFGTMHPDPIFMENFTDAVGEWCHAIRIGRRVRCLCCDERFVVGDEPGAFAAFDWDEDVGVGGFCKACALQSDDRLLDIAIEEVKRRSIRRID